MKREYRKYERRFKRTRRRRPIRILISIFKILLSIAIVVGGIFTLNIFLKNSENVSMITSISSVRGAIVDSWNGINVIQKIILLVSGLFITSALYQVCFSWNKGVAAFVMFLSTFYGAILFISAEKVVFIKTDAFVPLVITGEVAVVVSWKMFHKKISWSESLASVFLQVFMLIPGIIIAYLAGHTIMPGNDVDGSQMALLFVQAVVFLVMFIVQCIAFRGDGSPGFDLTDPLDDMTGDEGTGDDNDVSNY